jgi:hypothetical protein
MTSRETPDKTPAQRRPFVPIFKEKRQTLAPKDARNSARVVRSTIGSRIRSMITRLQGRS